eukprot:CAMPEP_0202915522 /NCGR_PEP_ID=MMETSP1392-20130828/65887_1 /ASSEMBLY_ACC=CAM_ASM_000868 /TAXON_ID=225041 /ORGANISM="Chlamydomonas chlamydogama, Strain SAG 11-48b" /LENGTH=387 /DNA_ID=CAMNT_0049607581 /DNA_START=21 /DNA_END=1184 /DNA_ORIENTATION=+
MFCRNVLQTAAQAQSLIALTGSRVTTYFNYHLPRYASSSAATNPPSYPGLPPSFLVVGGAGAFGSVVVDYLLRAGAQKVNVLDLKPSSFSDKRVESFVGSVDDVKLVDKAASGINTIVGCLTPDIPTATWNEFVSVIVLGTQTVLNSAANAGAKAFVQISSIGVSSCYVETINGKESDPLPHMRDYISPYDLTKRVSEEMVLQANSWKHSSMRTAALRPGGLLNGPRDYALRDIFDKSLVYYEGAPLAYIYGRNVCHAIALAASKLQDPASPAAGKAFYVAGTPITGGDLARALGRKLGRKLKNLPPPVLSIVGGLSYVSHAVGMVRAPHRTAAIPTARFLAISKYGKSFSHDLAHQLLGYEELWSLDEGLDLIVEEYKAGQAAANK